MLNIRAATHNDVEIIHNIAETWLLTNQKQPEKTGFLVSNYTIDEYHEFIDKDNHFFVAEIENIIQGFIFAYGSEHIKPTEIVNSILKYTVTVPFYLIKQICVRKNSRGIASKLYKHLFQNTETCYFLAAIVNEPANQPSIAFHKKHGFYPLWDVNPPEDRDGVKRIRSIWYRPAKQNNSNIETRIARLSENELVVNLIEKQHDAVLLYTHEDNLNWTKLGMLVSFMMALCAAFAFLIDKETSSDNQKIAILLMIFGFTINAIYWSKIKCSIKFMSSHKDLVSRLDSQISLYNPSLTPLLPNNIKNKSTTTQWLAHIPVYSTAIWTACSIMLVLKYF